MKAKVIILAEWKASHPPALACWRHGMACALAWQELWLKLMFSGRPFSCSVSQ
jgi:hypothetical protein